MSIDVTVKICGEAGQGIQTVGQLLALTCQQAGLFVMGINDFESSFEINDFFITFNELAPKLLSRLIREIARIRPLFPSEHEMSTNKKLTDLSDEMFYLRPYVQKFATVGISSKVTKDNNASEQAAFAAGLP